MGMGNGTRLNHAAILAAAKTFRERLGACVQNVAYQNTRSGEYQSSPSCPVETRVTVSPGITQLGGYFDIQWWANGDYKYHYREDGTQFRFGREEANQTRQLPVRHFHPPSDPDKHVESCIGPSSNPKVITRAVITTWSAAVQQNNQEVLNTHNGLP